MVANSKCVRCKKLTRNQDFCQNCKNELLPYFERTHDWQLAYDMEFANERMAQFKSDNEINDYFY
jgi:hypothetical protein